MSYLQDMKNDELLDLLARSTDEYIKLRLVKNETRSVQLKKLLKEVQQEIHSRKDPVTPGHGFRPQPSAA